MSGWIKLEKDLFTDPRVTVMAHKLRDRALAAGNGAGAQVASPDVAVYRTLVIGAVSILWMTCEAHIDEDDVVLLGAHHIDQLVGLQGFCELMPADWLQVLDEQRVKLPGFHRHNGTEAKKTALAAKRQRLHRAQQA